MFKEAFKSNTVVPTISQQHFRSAALSLKNNKQQQKLRFSALQILETFPYYYLYSFK